MSPEFLRKRLKRQVIRFVDDHLYADGYIGKIPNTRAVALRLKLVDPPDTSYRINPHNILFQRGIEVADSSNTVIINKRGIPVKENPGIIRMAIWSARIARLRRKGAKIRY